MNFKFLYFPISLFILLSCTSNEKGSSKPPKPNRISSSTETINNSRKLNNDSLVFNLGKEKQLYSLKFVVDPSKVNSLRVIKFYKGNALLQTIHANKNIERNQFELLDWNFDGYKDITVLDNCGSGGCTYWIWNYSPKDKKYVYSSQLSEHIGLEMDSISRYIVFHYTSGFSEENWDTLEYSNNNLDNISII